ncbi:hypothetical protein GOODEAATRI_027428 [Goodea atripinnis]|uniref:Uncharacterized protein n=1 Tax=Goodea atripinnis TaxID=208336 RepID=A0ABV0ML64_9TELE
MESSKGERGGEKKRKAGHKVLMHVRYKVHPATEKLSHKASLCCALERLLKALLKTFPRQGHFFSICLISVVARQRTEAHLYPPHMCVCVYECGCVCVNNI